MEVLLDTCTFLYLVADEQKLSAKASAIIFDEANNLYLSSISAWEIVYKFKLGKLTLAKSPELLIPQARAIYRINELPFLEIAATKLLTLPPLHKDPFDKMLICQSLQYNFTVLTNDAEFAKYPIPVIW